MLKHVVAKGAGGFVLAFHEIAAERFIALVECLRPARPVPLADLVRLAGRGRSTAGLFAITVDDGIGEGVRALAGVCGERTWPVTFYLPTRYLDTGEGMAFQWWRSIRPLLPARRFELSCGVFDLARRGELRRLEGVMETLWHTRTPERYLPDLAALRGAVVRERGPDQATIEPAAPIGWAEVEQLARCEWIAFESHGMTHTAMSALGEDELALELKQSRDLISERTGRECRHLAYPFGSPASIGPRVPAAAARYYDSAVTMSLGGVDGADPWRMPRIPLYPKNSALAAWMKVWLKCRAVPEDSPARGAAA